MFIVILATVLVLMHVYVWKRLVKGPPVRIGAPPDITVLSLECGP